MRPILLLSKHTFSASANQLLNELSEGFNMSQKRVVISQKQSYNIEELVSYLCNAESAVSKKCVESSLTTLEALIERADISMLLIDCNSNKEIKYYLQLCRDIRIPYIFVKPEHKISFNRVGVPVTFLVEEKEKGPFASAFGRLFNSSIVVFEPKDYGTKAIKNSEAICGLMSKFDFKVERVAVKKDSYKIEKYIAQQTLGYKLDFLIVTASRTYGLDDIILGPKELHIIRKSKVPVMLINPRGDLYTLCD